MSIKEMSELERKEYYRNAKQRSRGKQREQEKQEQEREEQGANPSFAQLLRAHNPGAKETNEELVRQWLAVHPVVKRASANQDPQIAGKEQ